MPVPDTSRHDTTRPDEVLTMGRMGVDIYPLQVGTSLRHVETFGKFLGGSPANVAVAAARLGRRSAVITRTGADPFGEFLHDALRGFGVDDRFVTPVPDLPTPVTFCEIFPPGRLPAVLLPLPTAPDLQIHADELDLDAIRDATIFWVTVTGLSQEPSREATLAALRARGRRGITILDLDYRPMFWSSREEARHWVAQALPLRRRGRRQPRRVRDGRRRARAVRRRRRRCTTRGVRSRDRQAGPDGRAAHDGRHRSRCRRCRSTWSTASARVTRSAAPCATPFSLGGTCERSMRFCNAAGAIVAGRLACADAMPTVDEVEAKIAEALDREAAPWMTRRFRDLVATRVRAARGRRRGGGQASPAHIAARRRTAG